MATASREAGKLTGSAQRRVGAVCRWDLRSRAAFLVHGFVAVLVDAVGEFCFHVVHLHPIPALGPQQSLPEQSLCLLMELEFLEHLHGDVSCRLAPLLLSQVVFYPNQRYTWKVILAKS